MKAPKQSEKINYDMCDNIAHIMQDHKTGWIIDLEYKKHQQSSQQQTILGRWKTHSA